MSCASSRRLSTLGTVTEPVEAAGSLPGHFLQSYNSIDHFGEVGVGRAMEFTAGPDLIGERNLLLDL